VTIAGVMPPDFYFPSRTAEFWQPIAIDPAQAPRGAHFLGVIARMKPGVALGQANAEMRTIAERLAQQYPDASANESAEVVPLHEQIVGRVRPALLTLLAAVGVVVLIACANVANLLLVRASVREKEVAIRAALGAGRRRLAFQMLVESVLLGFSGGVIGVLLAYLAIPVVQTLGANSIPRVADIAIDGRVLAVTFGASVLTGLLFGLAPAWHASRAGLGAVLKEGGRSSTTSGGRWVRSGLLVTEVALSIVLLVGATLLLRSFAKLTDVNPGFSSSNVLAFQVSLPLSTYPSDGPRITFFDTLLERLQAMPDVRATSIVQTLPMRGTYVLSVEIKGRPPATPGDELSASYRAISASYFETLNIPLLRGRLLTARDTEKPPMVAVIDDAFAKRYFPEEDPIGHGIDIGNGSDGFYEIVGVVGNVNYSGLDAAPPPTMYVPFKQDLFGTMWVLVKSDGEPSRLTGAVRQALREIDRTLPAYSITPLATVLSDSVADRRFSMVLLGFFALLAIFLAAVGLYGLVAYSVSQRTREIGLRMAIGARPGDVVRMVVGGGMKLAVLGVVIGLVAAVGLAQLVETMLFGVTPSDPASYGATALILLAVAALASYVPARRAMRVDPLTALQAE
jgi:putative ABC transport system permease protein